MYRAAPGHRGGALIVGAVREDGYLLVRGGRKGGDQGGEGTAAPAAGRMPASSSGEALGDGDADAAGVTQGGAVTASGSSVPAGSPPPGWPSAAPALSAIAAATGRSPAPSPAPGQVVAKASPTRPSCPTRSSRARGRRNRRMAASGRFFADRVDASVRRTPPGRCRAAGAGPAPRRLSDPGGLHSFEGMFSLSAPSALSPARRFGRAAMALAMMLALHAGIVADAAAAEGTTSCPSASTEHAPSEAGSQGLSDAGADRAMSGEKHTHPPFGTSHPGGPSAPCATAAPATADSSLALADRGATTSPATAEHALPASKANRLFRPPRG
jgi:hypothetical protein